MNGLYGLAARNLTREWRSGELGILLVALLVAVTSMTAVGFFTDRVGRAVDQQAAQILAADLVLRSGRELPANVLDEAAATGLATARKASFPSVVLAGDESSLVDVDAAGAGYPLRGSLRIADEPFGKARDTDRLPASGEAWAEARILGRLGIGLGDMLTLGELELRVTQVLDFAPDRGWSFSDLAPALLVNLADLPATGLILPGSRIYHYAMFAGSAEDIAAYKRELATRLEPGERLRDVGDARPEIRVTLDNARRFLGLAALAGALLAAVAVAMAARRYAARHLDTVALLKCLGMRQRLIVGLVVIQLAALALVAGVVGSLLGLASQAILTAILGDLIGSSLPAPSLRSAWLGLGTATALLAGFALPPLLALRHVPPARVLRRDLGSLQLGQALVYGSAMTTVVLLLWWLAGDAELVAYLLIGAVGTVAILALAGWALVRGVQRVRGVVGVAWRYGLANIGRRGSDSVAQIVAFGLGLMVLLLLGFVRSQLLDGWRASLPDDAPNQFLINIQADETDAVRAFLAEKTGTAPDLVPMIRARITHVDDTPVQELPVAGERGRRMATRESNLSWRTEPGAGNRIVAGEWWDPDDRVATEVSVEEEFARSLGIGLGNRMRFDVAGETVEATVTSLRSVRWETLQPNFFMVLSPGVLEDYPSTYIGAIFLADEQKKAMLELVRRFPSVTPLDMDVIFAQVRGVMDRASLAVQYVFLFTLVAGLVVLVATVQSTRDSRLYESAILRTLGASRRIITKGLAAEFSVLGLLAGILAAGGASVAGHLLATRVFELEMTSSWPIWLTGLTAGTLLVGVSGLLATRRVSSHPPAQTLRGF